MKNVYLLLTATMIVSLSVFSQQEEAVEKVAEKTVRTPEQLFNDYWYSGKAEISSYKLEQARYGELRKGMLVNVCVTETFSPETNTKADTSNKNNVKVLKFISNKKFNTGIYSYSILNSSFYPINSKKYQNSLKISTSLQEWCGHDYVELINKGDKYNVNLHSYYQGESVEDKEIDDEVLLEDDIWSVIRVNPKKLMISKNVKMLPSFSYLRFSHKEVKAYQANLSVSEKDGKVVYEIDYPNLNRNLQIIFESKFPYRVLSWKETCLEGTGSKRKLLTSTAELIKTIKSDYWNKNTNEDMYLRKELGIE